MDNLILLLQNLVGAIKNGQLPQLGYWTYFLLGILVAVEGPIATLLGAAAASAGLMHPTLVFLAAAIGNQAADSLWYSLGYLGKTEWIFHFGRRLGLRPGLIEHLKKNILQHATKVLFLAKLTGRFVIPSLVTVGLLRVPWRRWFPALILAETLWTGSLVLFGYYATEAFKRVEQKVEYAGLAASILFLVFIIFAGRGLIKEWDRDNSETFTSED
jgi:membrane protein DedA with SNARE-associated domain